MRLICPNCDAQYEVPAEVMPHEGRDVQCSNCGQTWFQQHPDYPSENENDLAHEPLEDEEYSAAVPEYSDPKAPKEEELTPSELEWDTPEPETDENALDTAPEDARPQRRELDPSVADVLRAEAELEARARREEGSSGMESQPDLGLPDTSDDADRRAREAQDRMAKIRGEYSDDGDGQELLAASTTTLGSRRDLLPDIEEINSTLRSNSDRSPTTDPGQTAQIEVQERRSSRLGFSLTVALVAILALIYVFAGPIAESVPQTGPALEGYVSIIDSWRAWLDTQLAAALSWLDDAAVSSGQ